MNRSGTGTGSASILLIFTVLCLTIFAFISFQTAQADRALTDNWKHTVISYYEADSLAELILADILESDGIPKTVRGVEIDAQISGGANEVTVAFSCPISDQKELRVIAVINEDYYDILEWQMRDIGSWVFDGGLPVWPG